MGDTNAYFQTPQSTFIDVLRWQARHNGDKQAFIFLTDGQQHEVAFSYAELDDQARRIAAILQHNGVQVGERVLLLYQPGLDYVAAVFGCFYAGVVAVPAYPPRLNHNLERIENIIHDAGARFTLTVKSILSGLQRKFGLHPLMQRLQWIVTDEQTTFISAEQWQSPTISSDMLALLQYTSGSTGNPKGVMIRHGNLIQNARIIQEAMELDAGMKIGSWLPPYHDMGLMGGILEAVYVGSSSVLMAPAAFLQQPLQWLRMISRYQLYGSGAPNFAFDLCVEKATSEQLVDLDLGSWNVAFTGAEPVRAETLRRFTETFAPYGFREEAFYPCYGMAEATLFISGGAPWKVPSVQSFDVAALELGKVAQVQASDASACSLVGCGYVREGQQAVIVDPETRTLCAPDQIGEIWVAAPNVAQGYWHKPQETQGTFQAFLKKSGQGPFLRTGDLGFMYEGELFVAGRLKDLLIIRGLNHYPQDIERSVEQSHPSLLPHSGAAVSVVEDGEEKLVIIQEVSRHNLADLQELCDQIYTSVIAKHAIYASHIVLMRQGSIPKTSSGKIQRYLCKQQFQHGTLAAVLMHWRRSLHLENESYDAFPVSSEREVASTDVIYNMKQEEIQVWLLSHLSQKLKIHEHKTDVSNPLTVYGLDSLAAIELKYEIESRFGVALPFTDLFEDTSLSQVASTIVAQRTQADPEAPHLSFPHLEETTYTLSYGQQSLWFLHQLVPDSSAYTISSAIRITGNLNLPAFRRALHDLMQRHPTLRATFDADTGKPFQSIRASIPGYLQEEDASTWTQVFLTKRLEEEAQRPFDLAKGPLVRFHLFKHGDEEYILLFVIHHIISDIWSLSLLFQEMQMLYRAARESEQHPYPPLSHTYIDYVRWQEKWLESSAGEAAWLYWKDQLANASSSVLNLLISKPRPPIQTYRGATLTIFLAPDLVRDVRLLAQQHSLTLYMILLSALQVLLHRYTGLEEFFIGSPMIGRSKKEWAGICGYFVNPVVLRADLSQSPSSSTLFERVRACVLQALEHQEYPFAKLVERLLPFRDPSRSPLFQVMFVLQKAHSIDGDDIASFMLGNMATQVKWGDISIDCLNLVQQKAQFDFTLSAIEMKENRMAASLEYNIDLFEKEDMACFLQQWVRVLEEMVRRPECPVAELDILGERERRQVVEQWNATACAYPQTACLHELVEQQVARTPEAIAVVFEEEQLTYAELNRRANGLAAWLRQLGGGPEVLVGVCMERSLALVGVLLAILKAGGGYVPLEPGMPAERLKYMLDDSQVQLVLTQPGFQERLEALSKAQVLVVSLDWQSDEVNRKTATDLEQVAYMIYTSGSTGKPKGVVNTHRGISNRLQWGHYTFPLGAQDRILQKTPFSFDISIWEFFWPLMSGARLVMARPGGHQDLGYLSRVIEEQQITTLHFVPSLLQVFLEPQIQESVRSVRQVFCSGEALAAGLVKRFFACFAEEIKLYNLYGPTEAAVEVMAWECRSEDDTEVPIGRPIANMQIYLLDGALRPVPIGWIGEIYIGGVGVARGYHRRLELTGEKFLPDPFGLRGPGTRMYRTGDLARWRNDGALMFLGRADQQVKLRGYRIELEEIEQVMEQAPQVRQAVVDMREEHAGDQRLIAYVVPEEGEEIRWSELRERMKEHLPEYMLPWACMVLDALPLTPNGKLDRRALPPPEQQRLLLHREAFVAPSTPVQEIVVQIWMDLLHVSQISIHDNFFALGGHSLLATQVLSQVRAVFQIDLPLQSIFEHPTVVAMAQIIEQVQGEPFHQADDGQLAQMLMEMGGMSDADFLEILTDTDRLE